MQFVCGPFHLSSGLHELGEIANPVSDGGYAFASVYNHVVNRPEGVALFMFKGGYYREYCITG